jgi:predicted dehydrogenase
MTAKKIGVLGCGMIAELGHLPAMKHLAGMSLHAVYDVNWTRSRAMQDRFHIPHAYPTETAFWESDIDAVVICTPAPLHLANVRKAAEYKKHVLCEKPLAMTEAEILQMIDIMEKAGLMLFTGFTYRFSASAKEIYRLVRSGAIGEVRALRLNYLWNLHGKWTWNEQGERVASRLRVGRMLEGGPMVDCGVHQIDLARWWLGSEVEWQRGIGVWIENYEAPDHIYLHMGHACGAHTMVEISFSYNATSREPRSHFQYELIGSDGVIRYNREEHSFELRNSHGTQWLPWHPEKNFAGMHAEFIHALTTGTPRDMPTARDGLLATRIARIATEEAIRDRERTSQDHPSTLARAANIHAAMNVSPLDLTEPEDAPGPSHFNPLTGVIK